MRWEVKGADRHSGDDVTIVIEANDEASARRRANRQGVLVSELRPLEDDDSVAGLAVPPAPVATVPPLDRGTPSQPVRQPAPPTVSYATPYPPPTVFPPFPYPPVQTVQQTSKVWKLQMLLAALCIFSSLFVCAGGSVAARGSNATSPLVGVAMLMFAGGFIWLIVAKVLAWWHHG